MAPPGKVEDGNEDTVRREQSAGTADLGEVIGGYELERELGSGGMGRVYAALHARLGRRAAVKVISARYSADREMLSRFYQEARIVNSVRHPNIVDIFDFVEIDEPRRVACIMEYLSGPSLKSVLEARRLTVVQSINVICQ